MRKYVGYLIGTFSRGALIALTTATVLLSGSLHASENRLKVVATTGMLADAAREVGGDEVDVRALMGPGVDPHAYRQTRTDIVALASADLVIWHGLFLEAQMEDFLLQLADEVPVLAAAEGLDRDRLIAHPDYEGRFDPHVWMDPRLWADVVIGIRDALIEQRPEHEDAFRANAAAYLDELEALAVYAAEILSTVPGDRRVLVTAHDAFGYFGEAYDFEVLGIQGISTESEAGLRRISDLVEILVSRQISAVFVESSVSDRNVRALVEGAAARDHAVEIGGELYSDAMGSEGTYEGTYIGMIDHNVSVIAEALGGDVPEGGMTGQLETIREAL